MANGDLSWQTTASKNRDRPPERTPALPRPCPDPQPQRRSNPPDVPAVSGTSSPLPQIIFTVWTSDPPSPNTESDWTKPEIFDFSGEHGPEWSYQAVTKDDHIAQGNAGESDQFRVGLEDNLKHSSCTSGQDISDSQRSFSTGSFNSKVSKDASLVKDGSLVWQNKDPEEDIAGFMITKNNIISVTTEEKERVEVPDDVRVIQVKRSGGACSDRVAEAGNVLHSGKPVLISFEEPMSLEAAYRQLWEITRCEDELGGQGGFQCGKVASDPNDEETRRNDGRNPSRDLGGQTEKVTSKEPRTLPKNPAPVPKPRVTQTKEPKSQRSSCGKIEFPKLHSMALSNVLRSGCTAKLKVIDVQKMIHSASATNLSGQGVSNVTKDIMAEDDNSVAWRSMDICRNTYQRLDSLEESIRELELTINEIGAKQPTASENTWTITSEQAQRDSLTQCDTNKVNSPAESPLLGSQREDAGKGSDPQANTKPPLLPKPKLPQNPHSGPDPRRSSTRRSKDSTKFRPDDGS